MDTSAHLSPTKQALLAIRDLQARLAVAEQVQAARSPEDTPTEAIAIIGQGCRFPQASDPEAFWSLLHHGMDAITDIPASRWAKEAYYDPNPEAPGKLYCPYGGFLEQVDTFDPQFFQISPREARSLDPQQRLLLEVSWEALENANQVPERLYNTAAGVFVGISTSDYALQTLKTQAAVIDAYFGTGNALSMAAGRLSYLLGLTGPSLVVDTACSSSLVAVHLACQSLRQGECHLALAGGVNLILSPENSISISKARMLSPDGRCKTFDARANGYVRGEGCGVVVLKRLKDAIADGDRVLAVIRGSAVNQDGPSGGLTVPNGPAQQALIRQALTNAGVEPQQVQYVEAHGTGTALGDPIELQALGAVYGHDRPATAPLIVGAVKTNIGHLEAAAGIAGLIKLVLALNHQEIPAHLHFQTPSPQIPWSDLPITIPTQNRPWTATAQPRLAGLSSFGFSGTNAHIILQEAPPIATPSDTNGGSDAGRDTGDRGAIALLTLAARTETALQQLAGRYATFLAAHPALDLSDVCFTANAYRSPFKHRLAIVSDDRQELQEQLQRIASGDVPALPETARSSQPPQIAFLFTGQGSQYSGMGQQLYQTQPLFRAILHRCDEILKPWLNLSLLALLYPDLYPANLPPDCLHATRYTQPALFAVEYALAQLWRSWGIHPAVVMGHSLGEYVAACIAGVFSLEDGLKLIAQRAKLMDALPQNGSMAAILADETVVREAIAPYADTVSIAAFNGPLNFVIAGDKTAIAQILQALETQRLSVRSLDVSHAFHSVLMEPMLEAFRTIAQTITYALPQLPLISNQTGQRVGAEIATADYWVQHVRQPVKFAQSALLLCEQGYDTWIEVGAKPILLAMAGRLIHAAKPPTAWLPLPTLSADREDWSVLFSSLGKLFGRGMDIDWRKIYEFQPRQRVSGLPTYPFQRQRYWFAEPAVLNSNGATNGFTNANSNGNGTANGATNGFTNGNGNGNGSANGATNDFLPLMVTDRRSQILDLLQRHISQSLVGEGGSVDPHASFLELGADSINLFETIQSIDRIFGIKVSVRQFFEELTTLDALSTYLDQVLPPHWELATTVATTLTSTQLQSTALASSTLEPPARHYQTPIQRDHTMTAVTHQMVALSEQMGVHLGAQAGASPMPQTSTKLPEAVSEPNTVGQIIQSQIDLLAQLLNRQLDLLAAQTATGSPARPLTQTQASSPLPPAAIDRATSAVMTEAVATESVVTEAIVTDALHGSRSVVQESMVQESIATASIARALPLPLTIAATDRTRPLPLALPQQRMWWLEQLAGEQNVYLIPVAVQLDGVLNVPALEASLNAVIARHESLRTAFYVVDGQPVQQVQPARSLQLLVTDVMLLPPAAPAQHLHLALQQLSHEPFDLEHDLLLRAQLLQLSDRQSILLLVFHHLVADAWSVGVLVRELLALYPAYSAGQTAVLPPLPIQYGDFAVWQRQGDADKQRHLKYWQRQLTDAPSLLALPTDYPRPAYQTFRGKTYHQPIGAALSQALKTFSQRSGVTLFMTLLSAYGILLSRYSGQTDLLVGSPIAARQLPETQPLIGLFLNTLILRLDLAGNPTVPELLERVKQVSLDAYAHPDLPVEQLVEVLKPDYHTSHSLWFQVMFILQSTPRPQLALSGLNLSVLPVATTSAKYDLTLWMEDGAEGLRAEWEYNTDLFSEATIARMSEHFQVLLHAIVAAPQQPISTLSLLSETEAHLLQSEWARANAPAFAPGLQPSPVTLHQLFEAQVQRSPDAIALEWGQHHLSYDQLNRQANQLAHYLKQQGLASEGLVGICLDRSPAQSVAFLAVLKAGGAYIPLDPHYPHKRLLGMVEDAQIALLLTESRWEEQWALSVPICYVDRLEKELAAQPTHNPATAVSPQQLAYVIYTSGSTGRPKGVMVEHRAVVNFVQQAILTYEIQATDRVLQFASASFDAAIEEIYPCLCSGGTLVLRTDDMISQMQGFLSACHDRRITVLDLPTAFWHQLTDAIGQDGLVLPPTLRLVIIGGERVLPTRVQQWLKRVEPSIVLVNTYGPTEATVVATTHPLTLEHLAVLPAHTSDPHASERLAEIPIGRPLGNVSVYVLDDSGRLAPIGVPGELHIGGLGLARGYLHQAQLTADRFIPHPLYPQERLYKTGDRVRWLPDGSLQYLGRADDQVKVRGFRVELGEVEAMVQSHPAVQAAIVLPLADPQGHIQLVCYGVLLPQADGDLHQVRSWLGDRLPDYMLPAAWIELAEVPLTPSGKLDRRALPQPDAQAFRGTGSTLAPRNDIEAQLAALWTELLPLSSIGVEESFFAVGGNSLLAMQLLARIQQTFQVNVSLPDLFHQPTIAQLAQRLQASLAQSGTPPVESAFPVIARVNRDQPLPLSLAQQRIWMLEQMEAAGAAYHIAVGQRIDGTLDRTILSQCLQVIGQRHEVLRTTFHLEGDRPVQRLHDTLDCPIDDRDLSALVVAESDLQVVMQAFAQQPFALAQGPLVRLALWQLQPGRQVLVLVVHHLIADAWSVGVLVQELLALYPALAQGSSPLPPLPALPIQYADFAVWQRQWLQGDRLTEQLRYWQTQLADAPALLALPTDRPRPASQTYTGALRHIALPLPLSQAVNRLSQTAGASLFMTLISAFAVVLYRHSQQAEFTIGSPIANRTHPQTQALMGLFLNTLVLRFNCAQQPSFREFLQRVQTVALEAYAHQDVPFEQLLEVLPTERHRSYAPWFQMMFILQNAHSHRFTLPHITSQPLSIDLGVAKFDLTLSMTETEQGLVGEWEYNCDLFNATTIDRMAAQFQQVLEAIVADPEQCIDTLPLLPASEQALLSTFTQVATPLAEPLQPVHQAFERQVRQTPDAIAVEQQGDGWSYRTLNEKANQLAGTLSARGVGAGDRVGVCLERGLETVAALLAILKTGAAYVPLDPTYPSERLHFMLQDAQVKGLLIQTALLERLALTDAGKTMGFVLSIEAVLAETASGENLTLPVDLSQPAYVIYTSGTTGQPKGTVLTHQGLANFTQQAIAHYGMTAADRVLQFASLSFDAAVEEIYPTLCSGGTLVLRTDTMLSDSITFCQSCAAQRLTVLDLPTAFWHRLTMDLAAGLAQLPAALRCVIIGGERALPQTVQTWQQVTRGTALTLFNTYGPTETTVVATVYALSAQAAATNGAEIPIGRPLGNVSVYVLDQQQQPVPVGVPGELYIGGMGLAAGYLNRPALTAERFLLHPQLKERLYRTGDRVRFLPNGDLVYLGRTDDQVKIRGFRVELGEVESALHQHPAVREAVVVVQPDHQPLQLIAYVVTTETQWQSQVLRQYLLTQLPDYMVPALFLPLDRLPLTPSGKLDRRALPQPTTADWVAPNEYVAPRTPTEAALSFTVAEVLGIQRVGIHDDFFSLGGHSLSAMQVLARIRTLFGKEVSLRSLFESPTVAALAAQLEGDGRELALAQTSQRIPTVDRSQPLVLSAAQQQLWFLSQLERDSATYNLPFALQLKGELNVAALTQCLNAIVLRHESLRTVFVERDGQGMQVIQPQMPLTIEVEAIAADPVAVPLDPTLQARIQREAQIPFNLQTGPLLRVVLLRRHLTEHILLVTLHHIIADAWSIGVFVQEVMALYPAFCEGRSSALPPLAVQYADYAAWQRQQQQTTSFQQRLQQWVEQLSDAPPLLELPTDYPRPAIQTFQGRLLRVFVPPTLTGQVQALSQQHRATLYATLLTAFVSLLHRYSRQTDLVVGTPIAGRDHPDLEPLIGFLINTLPLRFQLDGTQSFLTLLEQVQSTALDAFANQDIPFAKLVEALPLSRDLSYLPLCQVMFILQNAPETTLAIPGLTLDALPTHSGVSRFDLTLSMVLDGDRLIGAWEYNSDLFDAETITQMAAQFEVLLQALVTDPHQRLATAPLLTAADRHTLLTDWNQTHVELPLRCIHHWFEEQVERTPDAIALDEGESQLSYRDLNQRANQLAHYLQTLGIQPDQLVGICLERSVTMIVALLAVLKAGGAYVPLDPTYPVDRLSHMVNDSQLKVLLLQPGLEARFPELSPQVRCLPLALLAEPLSQQPQTNPVSAVQPHHLAYVIYTSGSTGLPKGVLVEHKGLGNLAFAQGQAFQVQPQSRILQLASLSFDASVSEIWMAFCAGARLCLGSIESLVGANLATLQQQQLTHLTVPPSVLHLLSVEGLATIDHLIVAGETCPAEVVAQWSHRSGFYNAYGPTETSVCATIAHCTQSTDKPPIGRPIQNVQVYVLDAQQQPVPIGVPGELWIGGIGVARGYLNRPELTAERFSRHPFSDSPADRLYRTGDLVRYRRDGQLDYLGRLDQQVKLRGFRMELGEIESVLLQHPAIRKAVVIVRQDDDTPLLAAYLVPEVTPETVPPRDNDNLVAELKTYVRDRLPNYMVPATFLCLEALPLSPNGKIDRHALPAPTDDDRRLQEHYVAPRNPIELTLVDLWGEILGLTTIGVEDNFFELGGHSMLAIQLLSRIQHSFQVDLPLQPLFETPTIAHLASLILSAQLQQTDDALLDQLFAEVEHLSDTAAQQLLNPE